MIGFPIINPRLSVVSNNGNDHSNLSRYKIKTNFSLSLLSAALVLAWNDE